MRASLQLKMGQSLALTPQLQQAIRLLQLSSLELQAEIQQTLESNPLLELEEEILDTELPIEEDADAPDISEVEITDLDNAAIPDELPTDSEWEDTFSNMPQHTATRSTNIDTPQFEDEDSSNESLQAYLMWQMALTPFSPVERIIATMLIDAINDDGYLISPLEDFHHSLSADVEGIELDEIEAVLHRIQQFDPIGVGARDLRESLWVQLHGLPADTPQLDLLKALVDKHLDTLAKHDHPRIKRDLSINDATLATLVTAIQQLNPRPGGHIHVDSTEYVVPDIYAVKHDGKWRLSLNPDNAPKLTIADHYARLITRGTGSADNQYLKANLQEARWFLKNLSSRNETLLKVTAAIIDRQQQFLEQGDEGMQPLILNEIAEAVAMHESTISRVTTRKYLHTPRGIFELKYFFSSHVSTATGAGCSATAIRARIRKYLAAENVKKPLSDNKIADMLNSEGIHVARRTIAKYREAMRIPPSNERKRLI